MFRSPNETLPKLITSTNRINYHHPSLYQFAIFIFPITTNRELKPWHQWRIFQWVRRWRRCPRWWPSMTTETSCDRSSSPLASLLRRGIELGKFGIDESEFRRGDGLSGAELRELLRNLDSESLWKNRNIKCLEYHWQTSDLSIWHSEIDSLHWMAVHIRHNTFSYFISHFVKDINWAFTLDPAHGISNRDSKTRLSKIAEAYCSASETMVLCIAQMSPYYGSISLFLKF